jgi:hypothetical protein
MKRLDKRREPMPWISDRNGHVWTGNSDFGGERCRRCYLERSPAWRFQPTFACPGKPQPIIIDLRCLAAPARDA